ncbi:MAG: SusC/RagA family TonB-linked outer membrane protein [Prevotellaceae bacterium]|jgi:TonB-linked SusC/RagA family outer membrane protein|nr:SusC/RagA family TonB-linked outer membrane protein [Prevotellaceae bacterium]
MNQKLLKFVSRNMLHWIALTAFVCGSSSSLYSQGKVTGKVSDKSGTPLAGVSVVIKGSNVGSLTNSDGNYSINTTGAENVLVFSFAGYETVETGAGNRTAIDVTLNEKTTQLDEIVVIGYGTARKQDLTGAISTVKAEKYAAEAPRSVQDLLRAHSVGLNISMSTNAAAQGDLQVRGKNTLTAGSSPLIVLDGVIYQGALQDINPMDIQTVDVLKDASAAAVYGAKAANGVVAISTKRGKASGKPDVTFNASVGFVEAANLPRTLDGPGFLKFRYDYEVGKTTKEDLEKYPGKFTDPRLLNGVSQLDWYNYTQKTPVTALPSEEELVRAWLTRLELKTPEIDNYLAGKITNWDDIVFQTGLQQDYTVALSNRNENTSYYWSLGYADREGVRANEKYTNFRTRLNIESKITKFLTVGFNASFNTRDELYLPTDDQRMIADVGQRENLSPYAANEIDNIDSPYRMYPNGDNNSKNPFIDALYRDKKNLSHFINANLYAQIFLPFGIEYQFNFTPYYRFREYYYHESSTHPEWRAGGGSSSRRTYKDYNWLIDNIVRWKHTFNRIHKFEVTLLANAEQDRYWETVANNTKYSPSDILGYHRLQAGTVPTVSSNDTYRTADALMGRLFYSLKDKYMITASVRRDGYSAFGQMNPRATFPSLALGWVFTSEQFMEKALSIIDYGKLRLSWGENGNRDIGQYEALSDLTASPHPYIDQNGAIYIASQLWVNRMSNKKLRWERTQAYNVGLDFSFFNGLISGSMEGYVSETNDLLVSRTLPTILGFDNVMANLGKMENKGFELTLDVHPVKTEIIDWTSTVNFSLNRSRLKSLYGDMVNVLDENGNVVGQKEADDKKNRWFIGQDQYRIWDYQRNGVYQLGEEEEAAKYGLQPGDFKYVDQNGDGVLTDDDKTFQGYTTPRYRWSWRNDVVLYKYWTFSLMLYSHLGHYDTFNRAANAVSLADRRTWYDIPRWTPETPENDYARIGSKNIGNNYLLKSFIRLENVALSYQVPRHFSKRFHVQDMRLSFSIRNAAVWAPQWNFGDPEGGDITPRTYNMSINFTL